MHRSDAVAAGTLLVFAAIVVHEASELPFGTVHNPGPGFLPWWAGVWLGLLAVVLLGQALAARLAAGGGEAGGRARKALGLLVALAAYVLAVEPLGYPASTFLLALFMLRVVDPQRWALALGVAAVAAIGSYALFAVWLQVPLPAGPLLAR